MLGFGLGSETLRISSIRLGRSLPKIFRDCRSRFGLKREPTLPRGYAFLNVVKPPVIFVNDLSILPMWDSLSHLVKVHAQFSFTHNACALTPIS